MTTTETSGHDARRRAELLVSRYTSLTEGNPGFHYHLHMRAEEADVAAADSVTAALVEGADPVDSLRRLVADERLFQLWRLRLEHPLWWIGGRVQHMNVPLTMIISELTGEGLDGGWGFHFGGGVGSHWFRRTQEAISPLSQPCRLRLAAALRRELLGRQLCMTTTATVRPGVDDVDISAEFPEHEFDTAGDAADPLREAIVASLRIVRPGVDDVDISAEFPEKEFDTRGDAADPLREAIVAVQRIHGPEWAEAFTTMLGDVDPINWTGVVEALLIEVHAQA